MIGKDQLYCYLRNIRVSATPEEHVRQKTLQHLVQVLNFPKSLIAVEKSLSLLQLKESSNRRSDIICYAKYPDGEMRPLLIIECKAVPISSKEIRQVIGYNYFLKASFIALVNQTEKKLGWVNPQVNDYEFIDYIPTYSELIKSVIY